MHHHSLQSRISTCSCGDLARLAAGRWQLGSSLHASCTHNLLGQFGSENFWEITWETEACGDVVGRFHHGQSMQRVVL